LGHAMPRLGENAGEDLDLKDESSSGDAFKARGTQGLGSITAKPARRIDDRKVEKRAGVAAADLADDPPPEGESLEVRSSNEPRAHGDVRDIERVEETRNVLGLGGKIRVHREDLPIAAVEGASNTVDVGGTKPVLSFSVKDRAARMARGDLVGYGSRAIGRVVVDDDHVDAIECRQAPRDDREVPLFVVGRKEDDGVVRCESIGSRRAEVGSPLGRQTPICIVAWSHGLLTPKKPSPYGHHRRLAVHERHKGAWIRRDSGPTPTKKTLRPGTNRVTRSQGLRLHPTRA